MLEAWCKARGFPPVPKVCLPKVGALSPGIAVGFLYQTDSAFAVLDTFIANPQTTAEQRSEALAAITSELINKAKMLGFKFLKAETKATTIEALARRHGFVAEVGFTCLFKEL